MNKHNKSRSSFSGKIGYVLAAAGASVGLGNIWRFPTSQQIRRRNFPPHLYPAGAHLRLLHDRCRVRHRTHDTKKPGRRFPVVRQIEMAFRRGLDQRHYPDSDRSILLCHRRMGHQISDRIREGQQYPARRGRLFFRLHLKTEFPQSSVLPFSALLRSPSSTPVCETALNAFPR